MSGAGSLRSHVASLWISLRCSPFSPRSMETVISPSSLGFTGIERRAASFNAHSRIPEAVEQRGCAAEQAGVLLQVDADAAK